MTDEKLNTALSLQRKIRDCQLVLDTPSDNIFGLVSLAHSCDLISESANNLIEAIRKDVEQIKADCEKEFAEL